MHLLRQVILLTLTLLLLVSATGISVGMHLCGGKLQGLSFYGEVTDCPMEQQKKEALPPCHAPRNDKTPSDDCCQDHTLVMESLQDASYTKPFILSKSLDLTFLAAVQAVILQLFAPEAAIAPAYSLYTSPPIARDIPVLVQSFLL